MNAGEAKAQLRDFLAEVGEDVTIRRYSGQGAAREVVKSVTLRARVVNYTAVQLIGAIVQGDQKVIASVEALTGDWLPLRMASDQILVRGKEVKIKSVDDNTRRIGGELVGLEIEVGG